MPSFSGIQMALQAILTQQQAMEITGHNIANAQTEGYHRQEAVLKAGPPQGTPGLSGTTIASQVGTGVVLDYIRRYNMDFIDTRYRSELAESKQGTVANEILKQVESNMAESGTAGMSSLMDSLWTSWQALATDPEDNSLRADLVDRAQALTGGFNARAQRLLNLQTDQNTAIVQRVNEINKLAEQVANLNVSIGRNTTSTGQPNDLLDQRDQILNRLSELSGAVTYIEDNGHAMVSIGGHVLVQGARTFSLNTSQTTTGGLVNIAWDDSTAFKPRAGELAGILSVRDEVIPDQLSRLNTLAKTLADEVNALHNPTPPGTGNNFFNYSDTNPNGGVALSIEVNPVITNDLTKIVTGQAAAAGDPPATGDGSVALAISRIQTKLVLSGGTATLNQYSVDRVTDLALKTQRAEINAKDHANITDSLDEQRQSVYGVNLNEEAANLVKYQRSYQAALRVMTATDDMLDRIINGMGRVGL